MILFIFEGEKSEPQIFNSLRKVGLFKESDIIEFCFCNNIYEFYKIVKTNSWDVFGSLKDSMNKNQKLFTLNKKILQYSEYNVSQIFLFFDYDIHNKNIEKNLMNQQIKEMLDFFNDETENGKLYISYPMIESLICTDKMPDEKSKSYFVAIEECNNFKKYVQEKYTYYDMKDFVILDSENKKDKIKAVRYLWIKFNSQTIKNVNYFCSGVYKIPNDKDIISQNCIFNAEKKFITSLDSKVFIINSFPLFLFEYYKKTEFLYKD